MSDIKLHDVVRILCDDDKHMTGVYVGDTVIYTDPGDYAYTSGDVGTPHRQMIIRLHLKYEGILAKGVYDPYDSFVEWEPVDLTEGIQMLVLDPVRVEKAPIYVNVYDADRAYGGPEEGGWYFDVRTPVESHTVDSREEAEELRESLREQYPDTGKRSSVLGGEDYDIVIEYEAPQQFPSERPVYS
jgi:hypothetical protein